MPEKELPEDRETVCDTCEHWGEPGDDGKPHCKIKASWCQNYKKKEGVK